MNLFRFLSAALLLLAAFRACPVAEAQDKSQQQDNSQQQNAPIRVSVDRVNVGVIVTDARGHFVEGLRREDFHIFDNGIEQPLTGFAAIDEPAQVLLLIEAGPAVLFLGKNHFRASETLINNLSPNDRVAIASYSKDPELLPDFTQDKSTARLVAQSLHFIAGFDQLNLSSTPSSPIC